MYEAKRKAEIAKLPKVPLTIVYDEYWASDYAANGAGMQCPTAMRQMCEAEARSEEATFLGKFSGAFQTDPTCAGMRLLVEHGRDNNSEQARRALAETYDKREHWWLMVNFSRNLQRQAWDMTHYDDLRQPSGRRASGDGDPLSMAHSVCQIAKNAGGSVID